MFAAFNINSIARNGRNAVAVRAAARGLHLPLPLHLLPYYPGSGPVGHALVKDKGI